MATYDQLAGMARQLLVNERNASYADWLAYQQAYNSAGTMVNNQGLITPNQLMGALQTANPQFAYQMAQAQQQAARDATAPNSPAFDNTHYNPVNPDPQFPTNGDGSTGTVRALNPGDTGYQPPPNTGGSGGTRQPGTRDPDWGAGPGVPPADPTPGGDYDVPPPRVGGPGGLNPNFPQPGLPQPGGPGYGNGSSGTLASYGLLSGPNGAILPVMLNGGRSPYQSQGLLGNVGPQDPVQLPQFTYDPNIPGYTIPQRPAFVDTNYSEWMGGTTGADWVYHDGDWRRVDGPPQLGGGRQEKSGMGSMAMLGQPATASPYLMGGGAQMPPALKGLL